MAAATTGRLTLRALPNAALNRDRVALTQAIAELWRVTVEWDTGRRESETGGLACPGSCAYHIMYHVYRIMYHVYRIMYLVYRIMYLVYRIMYLASTGMES